MPFTTIDLTKAVTGVLPDANANYSTPRKNANPIIINGNMAVSQRGTSSTSISTGNYYTCDRWKFEHTGNAGTFTLTQSTDVPSGYGFVNSFKMDCTTAQATIGSGNRIGIRHFFEGQDLQMFKKGTSNAEKFTLAFWVKSTKTGTFIAELYDEDNARQVSQAYTVSTTNTWEFKVINFPADTTGAFDNDNGSSMVLFLWTGGGTNFTSGTLNTSWGSATSANRAVGQVNASDSTSNDFLITGVQLEVGEFTSSTLPPFQHESFLSNKERCCRYYQNSFILGENPSTSTSTSNDVITTSWSDGNAPWQGMFQVQMRSSPTVTLRPRSSSNTGKVSNDGTERTAIPQQISEKTVAYINIISGNVGGYNAYNFVLNAEL